MRKLNPYEYFSILLILMVAEVHLQGTEITQNLEKDTTKFTFKLKIISIKTCYKILIKKSSLVLMQYSLKNECIVFQLWFG